MKLILPILLLLGSVVHADEPDHITLDPMRNWEPIVYPIDPNYPAADVVSIDLTGERAKFRSYDANKWGTFQYQLHIPIEIEHFPFLVMHYRATNLDTNANVPGLFVDVSPKGDLWMRPVASLNEFVADGKDQELRVDLRDKHLNKTMSGLMICVMATEGQTATLEISDIRFEAPAEQEHVAHVDDPPVLINLTDANGKPVKGAKVTIDAERKEAARTGKTDGQGSVTLTPLGNESGRHMIQIDADYLATTMVEIPADNKDPLSIQLQPGTIYSGFVQDQKGKPIEGATVRIFAPPPGNAASDHRVIRRAVVRTDQQGRWQSPVMPEEGKDPMFKLAHPDYVCDKEYNDTPLPPIDELKSGIGVMVLKKP